MPLLDGAFERHSPEEIRAALASGESPVEPWKGKLPIDWLIEYYPRTSRFADCLRAMLDAGARIEDPLLQAVLLDEPDALPASLHRISMECAYTSLYDVSALHVCAEYNSARCAKVLLDRIDVNDRGGIDADGLGGHTPLFHTVNSNRNYCRPMMELLVEAGADVDIHLRGLIWARGFDWETVVYDVTPISYAQCGLIRQFQRTEEDTYGNIDFLYRKRYGVAAPTRNAPNRYLLS
jgi:ankyrin repeat protein